jgi:predicted DNA-binding transcriptional regulator YafY
MLLQSRRVVTAAEMATYFEVTERTIYRDLAALAEGGVPILGEAGVGYSLMRGYRLPPVMFSSEEAAALVTGGMLAEQMTDQSVRGPMRTALVKLTAILPAELQCRTHRLRDVMSVQSRKPASGVVPLSRVQAATADRQLLRLTYKDDTRGETVDRDVEPLGLVYYLQEWHLIAWCRLQNAVRDFRVDRITHCETLPELLPKRADFDLQAYLNLPCGDGESYGVVIEVHPAFVESVRHHGGIKVSIPGKERGWECFHFRTPCLEYFARWIVSLGDRVIVRKPSELARLVLDISELTFRHHQKNRPTQNRS